MSTIGPKFSDPRLPLKSQYILETGGSDRGFQTAVTIRLYQVISKMIQIKLQKSGAFGDTANYPNTCFRSAITWVHNSLVSQCCDGFRTQGLVTPQAYNDIVFNASQCGWQFMGLCWVDPYRSILSPICLLSGQSCQWKKKLEQKKSGLVQLIKEKLIFCRSCVYCFCFKIKQSF